MTTGAGACSDRCTAVATPLKPPPTTRTRGRSGPGDRACDKDPGGARPGSRPAVASRPQARRGIERHAEDLACAGAVCGGHRQVKLEGDGEAPRLARAANLCG